MDNVVESFHDDTQFVYGVLQKPRVYPDATVGRRVAVTQGAQQIRERMKRTSEGFCQVLDDFLIVSLE